MFNEGLTNLWELLHEVDRHERGILIRIRTGLHCSFWRDNWMGSCYYNSI